MKKLVFLVISLIIGLYTEAQTKEGEMYCDSAMIFGLIKAQVKYFDIHGWDNYQIPEYDAESKRYIVLVTQYNGEWGGTTSAYFYKKTRYGFRLTKKAIGQTSC